MSPKIKNIIIFTVIAIVVILLYIFFIKKSPEEAPLVSTTGAPVSAGADTSSPGNQITQEFLTLLLSVKSIHLDDSVLLDPAFSTLRDSSIELVPDGTEGRPNPFAPLGFDAKI